MTDIKHDHIKFVVKKEAMGLFDVYVTDLVVMPDPTTPVSTGLSTVGVSTTAAVSVQLAAHRMVKKILARYWEGEFQNNSYHLLHRAVLPGEDPDIARLEMFSVLV